MYGCGLVVINPPHLLDAVLSSSLLPFLSTALASPTAPADFAVEWLNPELTCAGNAEREGGQEKASSTGAVYRT